MDDPLTREELNQLFDELDIAIERENTRTTLFGREAQALDERGVIIVGNRLIFTETSRKQMQAALDSGDYSALTAQQIAALNIMARQAEREEV